MIICNHITEKNDDHNAISYALQKNGRNIRLEVYLRL